MALRWLRRPAGDAPKFPRPSVPDFLLRYHVRTGGAQARDMALYTLSKMAMGGLHEHLGGGFHSYSVDARWHVPHFEKMLYDQGQLACTYLAAYQLTRDPFFAGVACGILEYVRRDMTGEQGQFYSAEDADSSRPANPLESAEGAFYVWTWAELAEALGAEAAELFAFAYGVEPGVNVRDGPHGEFRGRNVLILSRADQVLGDNAYLTAARRAADFIRANLYDESRGVLLRRYRAGKAALDGYADDYAFLVRGLLDLYEAFFDIAHVEWALEFHLDKPRQIVIAGRSGAEDTLALLAVVRERFSPNRIVLLADGGRGQQWLAQRLAFLHDLVPLNGKATAYMCENYACRAPVTSAAGLREQLGRG